MYIIDSAGTNQFTCIHQFGGYNETQFICSSNEICCGDKCCNIDITLNPPFWIGVALLLASVLTGFIAWATCGRHTTKRDKSNLQLKSRYTERPDTIGSDEQCSSIKTALFAQHSQ